MSTIRIKRGSGSIADKYRPYKILIDGENRGDVAVGEVVIVPTTPGIHTVKFEIDYYCSASVMVHVGEGETSFHCWSNRRRMFGLLSLFAPDTWIKTLVKEDAHLVAAEPAARRTPSLSPISQSRLGSALPKAYLRQQFGRIRVSATADQATLGH